MASGMPLPIPPRTPTPPPEDLQDHVGLGIIEPEQQQSPTKLGFNPDALSPVSATFPAHSFGSLNSPRSLRSPLSPSNLSSYSPLTAGSQASEPSSAGLNGVSENVKGPFNFQTVSYTIGKPPAKQDIGRRRGHKYKHSSVSHQIFLEPPPRAPLQLPASLPIPTFREFRASMSKEQKYRASWCCCHLAIAGYVLWAAHESLALTVLSRLIFFDALGAFLCVTVDVGSNFEVWKRSSIKHPFGLERTEVVAGLAMSVTLLFMGLDLISHGLSHTLENKGGHEAHHPHEHERVGAGEVDLAALLAVVSTLVSAIGLKNHSRIGKVMRFAYFDNLPSVLQNPSHLLTLSCSALLLLLPLLSLHTYVWFDRVLSFCIAMAMIALGARLGWTLGKILMMSYTGPGLESVLLDIQSDPSITGVEEAKFWQVNYGLCQANLRLRVRTLDGMERLRERIGSLVKNRLGGGYGVGSSGMKWEVSLQLSLDRGF